MRGGNMIAEVESALAELMQAGRIEAVMRRGAAHYRMIRTERQSDGPDYDGTHA